MKSKLILGLVFVLIIGAANIGLAFADDKDPAAIKNAIQKYKNKNYLGCISDLKEYTKEDETSSVAWYYLGSAYMKIAMQDEANQAFDKVVSLNKVPQLVSYSIQAQLCMKDPAQCTYKSFTKDEIEQLRLDPAKFLEEYNKPKVEEVPVVEVQEAEPEDPRVVQINRLINGECPNNIHEDADIFIKQENMKIEQNKMR